MGTVYRGTHGLMDKTVAVKVLRPSLAADEKNRGAVFPESASGLENQSPARAECYGLWRKRRRRGVLDYGIPQRSNT